MPSISPDSYIRLPYHQLQAIGLDHLISDMDADDAPAASGQAGAGATAISGYTEWVSAAAPRISLGWDWELVSRDGGVSLRRLGLPRSNVMLLDAAGADLGPDASAALLGRLVDQLDWQDTTWRHVGARNPG